MPQVRTNTPTTVRFSTRLLSRGLCTFPGPLYRATTGGTASEDAKRISGKAQKKGGDVQRSLKLLGSQRLQVEGGGIFCPFVPCCSGEGAIGMRSSQACTLALGVQQGSLAPVRPQGTFGKKIVFGP